MEQERINKVSDLIESTIHELDLSPDMYKFAYNLYEHLAKWIKEDSPNRFNADAIIYPQGSMVTGTIIRPINGKSACDLDIIYCRFVKKENQSQKELMEEVGNQLKDYVKTFSKYNKEELHIPSIKLEEFPECWTIYYGDYFSMDIVPSLPDPETINRYSIMPEDGICVSSDTIFWQYSNPKGYAKWFKERDNKQILMEQLDKIAKKADVEIEKLPFWQNLTIPSPLRRSIQILKRHRDIKYKGDKAFKPSSLAITTLVAEFYSGEKNIHESLFNLIPKIKEKLQSKQSSRITILDPTCKNTEKFPANNFIKQWEIDNRYETAFIEWFEMAEQDLLNLYSDKNASSGMHKYGELLSENFGSDVVRKVFTEKAKETKEFRDSGLLRTAVSGVLGKVGNEVKPHTFFGSDK